MQNQAQQTALVLEMRQRIEKLERAIQEKPTEEQKQPAPHTAEEKVPAARVDAAAPIRKIFEEGLSASIRSDYLRFA